MSLSVVNTNILYNDGIDTVKQVLCRLWSTNPSLTVGWAGDMITERGVKTGKRESQHRGRGELRSEIPSHLSAITRLITVIRSHLLFVVKVALLGFSLQRSDMSVEGDASNSCAPVLNSDLSGRSAMCIENRNCHKLKPQRGNMSYRLHPHMTQYIRATCVKFG